MNHAERQLANAGMTSLVGYRIRCLNIVVDMCVGGC